MRTWIRRRSDKFSCRKQQINLMPGSGFINLVAALRLILLKEDALVTSSSNTVIPGQDLRNDVLRDGNRCQWTPLCLLDPEKWPKDRSLSTHIYHRMTMNTKGHNQPASLNPSCGARPSSDLEYQQVPRLLRRTNRFLVSQRRPS